MIGQTFSHYRILGKLGHGGMGVVYLAEDTHLGRKVAIKFSNASPDNSQYRARFLREARAASALNHPHIGGIYDYGETPDGRPYIVMELVSGEDLFHLLRRGPLSLGQSLRVAKDVAEALAEAHQVGIVHRDIKPANIIINDRGQVKVLDFGLAKQFGERPPSGPIPETESSAATIEGITVGTPLYMSPEQAKSAPLGPPSDLFSLGAVLYECLAGRPAFSGSSAVEILAAVLHVDPPPPSRFNPRVTPEMERIVTKALAKDPGNRYQSAEEMAADLKSELTALTAIDSQETELLPVIQATQPVTLSSTLQTWVAPLRRSRLALVSLLAVILAAAIWLALPGGSYRSAPDAARWYREGVTALRDATYYKASKALERAAHDDRFAMAHARLSEAWMELDYADKAKEEMLRAQPPGSKPRLTRAEESYMQALHLTLTGDFAGATAKYREIVGRVPDSEKANAYVDLGRAYERGEKLPDAVASYREASRLEPQNPAAWLRLAILYGRQSDQAHAATAFREAESLYRSLSNTEGITEVLYQRGVLANKLGKIAEARALLEQALDMSRSIGSVHQQIVVLLQLSGVDKASDMSQAERDATQALDLARANGLENLTTRGLIDLGNTYFVRGEYDEAKKYFAQSLEYARRYRSGRSEARALLSLGSLEIQRAHFEEGLRYVQRALDWYQRGGYQKETAQALILVARARRAFGDYQGALASFQQQLQIARKLGDLPQVVVALQGVAGVLESQGNLPEALARYREAYETAKQSADSLSAAYCLLLECDVEWQLGRYDEARGSLDRLAPGLPRDLTERADRIRASMMLSQRQFAAVIGACRRLLAQPGLRSDLAAQTRMLLGLAQAGSGARREGVASTAEAVALAAKLNRPNFIAEAALAHAEAQLAAGDSTKAREAALDAQRQFARLGRTEGEWRAWLAAGDSTKASELLAVLEKKWDPESYKKYTSRPDIQYLLSKVHETKK